MQFTKPNFRYGFLSESAALAAACLDSAHEGDGTLKFIGPSVETLRIASDKMLSRELASSVGVNVAPGRRVTSNSDVKAFIKQVGYPVIIKALDGGGGRGIRVVEHEGTLEESFKR